MNSSIVSEDIIKLNGPVTHLVVNREFLVFILKDDPKTAKIRHLYDQQYKDLTTGYSNPITKIFITDSNHLVIVDDTDQVDVSFLQTNTELQLSNVKTFAKKGLVEVVCTYNTVAFMTESKIYFLELSQTKCNRYNKDLGYSPLRAAFTGDNLFIYCADKTIKRWIKSAGGKYQESPQVVNLKEQITQMYGVVNSKNNYLVCVSKDEQVMALSSQGVVIDLLNYEGQFKVLKVNQGLVTIISKVNQGQVLSIYINEPNYDPQGSRKFFNKSQSYDRNAQYDSEETLLISRKEWPAYCKRKGVKETHPVTCVTEDTFCMIFCKLASDPSKIEILKVDASKVLSKDRSSQPTSKYRKFQSLEAPGHVKSPDKTTTQPNVQAKRMVLSDEFLSAVKKIVHERVTPLIDRITSLQQKLSSIESKISKISSESQMSKLYSSTIQKQMIGLFENKIVPKMEEYFSHIFKDLALVFNQGIEYYNQKLIVETEIQKGAFRDIITYTQKATNDILQATKADLPNTLRVEDLLKECLRKKDALLEKAGELLHQVENGPFSYKTAEVKEVKKEEKPKDNGKVKPQKIFVKTGIQ